MFGVSFKFSGELFFVVLLELLLDDSDDGGYFFVIAFSEKLVHFLIGKVPSIEVDKTFESSILLLLSKTLLGYSFLPVVSYLFQHEG